MKIRVYELAKELNMTNKALLDKIKKMGDIDIRSHMSSLESNDIERIKARLLGKENQPEEKRVKPTVIRRRKKKESNQDDSDFDPENSEVSIETEKDANQEAEIIKDTVKKDTETNEELETDTIIVPETTPENGKEDNKEITPETEKQPVKTTSENDRKKARKTKNKKTTSAKIIFRPEVQKIEKKEPPEEKNKKVSKKEFPKKIKEKTSVSHKKPVVKEVLFEEIKNPSIPLKTINTVDDDDIKKGSKLNKGRNQAEDAKRPKKKIKSKKKEVVEKEDLYGPKGKKSKKGKKVRRQQDKKRPVFQKTQITIPKAIKRRIKVDDTIILAELAKRMGIKANEMIVKLMGLGVMATVNQTIDFETAELVATEFGFEVEKAAFEEEAIINLHHDDNTTENMVHKPPVVTVMGHVDHGKTSLLDAIRHTGVAEGEAGGITQHIGAYIVHTDGGDITFLDTPGHEAFTSMRSRGAQITDIVILVVAADDGVMPQTIEAINHARAAEVPMVVAVNKIDKPGAEPEVVKRELSEHGVLSEGWGGDTIFVNVSAKEKTGIEELLEMILLQAEILDLKATPDKFAKGHVIEAKLDSGRGSVASILIQEGTLNQGDSIVCGIHYGKIRAMFNDQGKKIKSAGPSIPVEIIGLSGVPEAGDELIALKDEKEAKQVGEHRAAKQRAKDLAKTSRMSLEGLFERIEQQEIKDLNLIIKADVQGSIEALKDALIKLSTDEVKIKIIHSATGTVSESDISLASVSDAIILGFNVRPAPKVRELAEEENIDMKFYNVIYDAIQDIQNAMLGLMASTFKEVIMGTAEVRAVFSVPKIGKIAGCFVTHGTMKRNLNTRVLRDGVILFDGQMASLKRFKDDVREVNSNYECGIGIEKFNDIKEGDIIECYMLEEEKPTL